MYFFFKNKKQYLDLTGDLILSHNDQLVKARTKSAGPVKVLNAKFVINAGKLTFWGKWKATKIALSFIWGKPNPLTAENTNLNKPVVKNKTSDTETEGRLNCPVIDMHCEYFAYQCDRNGEIAISHCGHPENKSETEGNCIKELCPKLVRNNKS